jgi:hypothetical protein
VLTPTDPRVRAPVRARTEVPERTATVSHGQGVSRPAGQPIRRVPSVQRHRLPKADSPAPTTLLTDLLTTTVDAWRQPWTPRSTSELYDPVSWTVMDFPWTRTASCEETCETGLARGSAGGAGY